MAPTTKSKHKKQYDKKFLLDAYRDMIYYRRFEERVNVSYTKRKFSGFCHLHIGQEAVCVGVQRCLRDTDYMISGYRSHTQAIAKGIPSQQVFAELYGKQTGCSKGKGGSMHMFSKQHRFLGGHGIVGGQVPLATGVAFAINYRSEDNIMVCYMGDGAISQGQFFESLNMAETWKLPCLYIIENNQYGMGTDYRRVTSLENLQDRAKGFGMNNSQVDGMNFISVYEHTKPIVEDMRKSKKPHLLEIKTYRYKGHSVSDPGNYRTKEEVKKYQDLDPISQQKAFLIELGISTAEKLTEMDKQIKLEVKEAEKFADESPQPELDAIWQDVYVD